MKIYPIFADFIKQKFQKSWGLHDKDTRSEIPWESETLFCST